MEPLDNPVWHALTGPQAEFSEGSSLALRFQPDVSVFAALPDDVGPDAWEALARVVGPGATTTIFRPAPVRLPPDWDLVVSMSSLQMVATELIGQRDDSFAALGAGDVDEMLALVERTRPGPFKPRTPELGAYLGRRADAGAGPGTRLVAMTGERLHPAGFVELSAVCTDADARKQGLATRLVRAVAAGIEARAETPILHVLAENHAAIRIYEALGFTTRVAFETLVVRAPS